jgi:antitoxin FitA
LNQEITVAQLIVRDVDESIVDALKKRAAARRLSTEALHRQILQEAVSPYRRRTLAEALAQMPNVGEDTDFDRHASRSRR